MRFLLLLLLTSCSGTQHLGTIHGTEYYAIHISRIDGPNITALVIRRPNLPPTIHQTFAGPGIATSTLPAIVSGGTYITGKGTRTSTHTTQVVKSHNHAHGKKFHKR